MTRQRYEGLVRELIRRIAVYNHTKGDGAMQTGKAIQYAMQNTARCVREQGKSYKQAWEEIKITRELFDM